MPLGTFSRTCIAFGFATRWFLSPSVLSYQVQQDRDREITTNTIANGIGRTTSAILGAVIAELQYYAGRQY